MANPYLQVLRTPHALPMVAAAFIGRLPLSMVGLGCVLLVASETGSYGLGGAIAAVGAVTTALAGPVIGRLADTRGQRRVLLPVLLIFVVSGLTFLAAIKHGWPLWTVFLSAGVSGACIPPISSMIRVRWTYLLRGSGRLPTALAMESVVDELVFIVGPVLVTFLSTTGHATSGVVTAFTLATVGSLLFAAQARTEPPPGGHESRSGPSAMRTPGLRVLFVVGASVGAVLGTLEIALVGFAHQVGATSMSGVLIAALAVGSMASGIGWGTVQWTVPLHRRLSWVLVLLTLCSIPLLMVGHIRGMVPFVALAGVAVSPSLISSFTLAEVLVPRAVVTEAFTWIGTALGLGVAVGASVAGKIVDVAGANAAFLVATVAAGLAAVVVALCQRLLHVPAEHPSAPALARVTGPVVPPGARTIDDLLTTVRARIGRIPPTEVPARTAAGALLVDTRPWEQRCRDGAVPGAVVVDRNVLEWRLDPSSPHRIPQVTGYDLEVIVLCNEGYSSSLVADTLRTLGLTRTVDVIGGFVAWVAAGLPTVPATEEDVAA